LIVYVALFWRRFSHYYDCKWLLAALLPALSNRHAFDTIQSCISEVDLELILRKTFESEVCLHSSLEKKSFEMMPGDQDSVDLLQAVIPSDAMRMKHLLKRRKLGLMDIACYTLVPNMGREILSGHLSQTLATTSTT
jgi:hypothetical protein